MQFFIWVFCAGAWGLICASQLCASNEATPIRNATDFPGASIVEQIQAAIHDCASSPCDVYIPAGTYSSSPISSWRVHDVTGASVGAAIPSNVQIRGAGKGRTIIQVTRSAIDPAATLFANANKSNRNIRLSDMSITWTDSSQKYDWVSIFICHGCDQLELDHLSLEGNSNKLVNLLDGARLSVHDNVFLLHSTGYGHGDNALGVSRFDPSVSVSGAAGVVRDNYFTQTGDYRTFSMLIITQSGLDVHSNVFEAPLSPPGNAVGIELGQDNLGLVPDYIKIDENTFHGASIAHGGISNSEISDNFFVNGDIYIALQSGSTSSVSGLTIANNELHFGSINIAGLEHTFTGRMTITRNRVFDGHIGTGAASVVHDIEVTDNLVRYATNHSGIDCYGCSMVKGNIVRDSGGHNAPGYLISGTVPEVSDNVFIDEQHDYNAGTICSIAKPSSTLCLPSGRSRYVLLSGGEWGFGWTNRTLFTDRGNFPIRAFVGNSVLELDDNPLDNKNVAFFPTGLPYYLSHAAFIGFELNNAVIERFTNNTAISSEGFRQAAVQENGTVNVHSVSGNYFHPYNCYGKCAADYRSNTSAPY